MSKSQAARTVARALAEQGGARRRRLTSSPCHTSDVTAAATTPGGVARPRILSALLSENQ
eukprot:6204003-Pleurochrysis_carterae.AAC.4